jgi:hypothetical protein
MIAELTNGDEGASGEGGAINFCDLARSGMRWMYGLDGRVGWWYKINVVGDGEVLSWENGER